MGGRFKLVNKGNSGKISEAEFADAHGSIAQELAKARKEEAELKAKLTEAEGKNSDARELTRKTATARALVAELAELGAGTCKLHKADSECCPRANELLRSFVQHYVPEGRQVVLVGDQSAEVVTQTVRAAGHDTSKLVVEAGGTLDM